MKPRGRSPPRPWLAGGPELSPSSARDEKTQTKQTLFFERVSSTEIMEVTSFPSLWHPQSPWRPSAAVTELGPGERPVSPARGQTPWGPRWMPRSRQDRPQRIGKPPVSDRRGTWPRPPRPTKPRWGTAGGSCSSPSGSEMEAKENAEGMRAARRLPQNTRGDKCPRLKPFGGDALRPRQRPPGAGTQSSSVAPERPRQQSGNTGSARPLHSAQIGQTQTQTQSRSSEKQSKERGEENTFPANSTHVFSSPTSKGLWAAASQEESPGQLWGGEVGACSRIQEPLWRNTPRPPQGPCGRRPVLGSY